MVRQGIYYGLVIFVFVLAFARFLMRKHPFTQFSLTQLFDILASIQVCTVIGSCIDITKPRYHSVLNIMATINTVISHLSMLDEVGPKKSAPRSLGQEILFE